MAALDFPASPTVGSTYTAPNGVIYQWDGTTWQVTGPASGQAAGGSLAGFYPNPSLAVGAAIRQLVTKAIPAGFQSTAAAWTAITSQAITTSGGCVLYVAAVGWIAAALADSNSYNFGIGIGVDGVTPVVSANYGVRSPTVAGSTMRVPLPHFVALGYPAAGTHTVYLSCAVGTSTTFLGTDATGPGTLYLVEFA